MSKTIILKDASVVNIYKDGAVELFPSNKWKSSGKTKCREGIGYCHLFQFKNYKQAMAIVDLLNIT